MQNLEIKNSKKWLR